MPFGLGLTVAILGILLGYLALRRNLSTLPGKRWLVWVLLVLGVGAGVPLGSMASHRDDTIQIYGVPLTAVILELHHGRWLDFVGPTTPVGVLLNSLAWAALWQVIIAVALRVGGGRPQEIAAPS